MRFLLIFLTTFSAMEALAYFAHKYLFHGALWFLHKSHHFPRKGAFELNDLFGIFFIPISMALMGGWLAPDRVETTFPIGLGMTAYGAVYLFLHDIFTHRRIISINSRNKWLHEMRAAHRSHHSSLEKKGQEPYGFVYFGKRALLISSFLRR
jgi:beta-carotene 3-hydroxylase